MNITFNENEFVYFETLEDGDVFMDTRSDFGIYMKIPYRIMADDTSINVVNIKDGCLYYYKRDIKVKKVEYEFMIK